MLALGKSSYSTARAPSTLVTVAWRSHPNKQVGGVSCALSLCLSCVASARSNNVATLVWVLSSPRPHVPTIAVIIPFPQASDEQQQRKKKHAPSPLPQKKHIQTSLAATHRSAMWNCTLFSTKCNELLSGIFINQGVSMSDCIQQSSAV